jgi:uncharacterized protein
MNEDASGERMRRLIDAGDVDGLSTLLAAQPELARRPIRWQLDRWNESAPLHYVSDSVGHGWLTNGREGELAAALLAAGAALEGSGDRESPLIAAASLGAGKVAKLLLDSGAELERTSVFGARALHWAAWTGDAGTVRLLLARRAQIEARCDEFGATPLFWAVHGFGPRGPRDKSGQVDAARALLDAGARIQTTNKHGVHAREMARGYTRRAMSDLLEQYAAGI